MSSFFPPPSPLHANISCWNIKQILFYYMDEMLTVQCVTVCTMCNNCQEWTRRSGKNYFSTKNAENLRWNKKEKERNKQMIKCNMYGEHRT